jgi:hypothetical protein
MTINSQRESTPTDLILERKRPAVTPRAISRPQKEKRLKTSTFLGLLLFLQRNNQLTEDQQRFVLKLQANSKLEELESAFILLRKLEVSSRTLARSASDLELARKKCGRIEAKSHSPEARRIGVGYRDKGALRPAHKARTVGSISFWSDDLAPALLVPPEEPRWISSEELFGSKGYDPIQELALRAVFGQNSTSLLSLNFRGKSED